MIFKKLKKSLIKTIFLICFYLMLCLSASAEVILQDNFEYAVDRDTAESAHIFTTTGPWDFVKAINGGESGARAYFYTATSIPGFSGSFPGQNSSRVMCQEYQGAGGQTDAYVGISGAVGRVPANAWFQFWVYVQRYGSQMSNPVEGKFIYPCGNTAVGTCPNPDLDWLFVFQKNNSFSTFNKTDAPVGSFYLIMDSPNEAMHYDGPGASWRHNLVGYNLNESQGRFDPNVWTLVKVHIDMRNASGGWEMWKRTPGTSFVKIAEYLGGVTNGYSQTPEYTSGMAWFKWMTTLNCDMWFYYDDFILATTEGDLPTYGGTDTTPPAAPSGVTVS